jgi:hypothetical protein
VTDYLLEAIIRFCYSLPAEEQFDFARDTYMLLMKPPTLAKDEVPKLALNSIHNKSQQMLAIWGHYLKSITYYRTCFPQLPKREIDVLCLQLDYSTATGKQMSDSQAYEIIDNHDSLIETLNGYVSKFTEEMGIAWYGLTLKGIPELSAAIEITRRYH